MFFMYKNMPKHPFALQSDTNFYLLTKTNVYEKIYIFLVTGCCFCNSNSTGGDRYQLRPTEQRQDVFH